MIPAILFPAVWGAAVALGELSASPAAPSVRSEHPNALVVRRFYAALERGDLAGLYDLLDEGFSCAAATGPRAGRVMGKAEAAVELARTARRTGGTFRVEVRALFASDERAVAVVTERAEREDEGLRLAEDGVHVFRFREGRITSLSGVPERPDAVARFWR